MRAVLVSVDYAGELSISLPYNRHHFTEVMVVTSPADAPNVRPIVERCNAKLFVTDLFYADGAPFNKFRAMEAGLDAFGRDGWLAILDADVLWPARKVFTYLQENKEVCGLVSGYLFTPRRRMWTEWPKAPSWFEKAKGSSSADLWAREDLWDRFPLHPQDKEWAGYSQLFHASDPVLGPPPWHETNWLHAGGADSFFQAKWPDARKVRPPFEVLHLGTAGINWAGRVSAYADGTMPPEAAARLRQVRDFRARRVPGPNRFRHEKLS